MMNKFHLFFGFITIIVFSLISTSPAFAEVTTLGFEKLFINGEKFNNAFIIENDEVYLEEEDINKIYSGYDIKFNTDTQTVTISGKQTSLLMNGVSGTPFYPLLAITQELGYSSKWDYKNKVISIDTKTFATANETSNEQYRSGRRPRRALTITVFKEEPIKNVSEEITALRVYTDISNTRLKAVPEAKAICIFSYLDGREYYRDEQTITDIKPGEIRRVIFYAANPDTKQKPIFKISCSQVKK